MTSNELRLQMRRLVLAEGLPIETVARRFGVHHSTVRRALADESTPEPPAGTSVIEPFKPYIVERLSELPELTASRLMLELRDRGYKYGIAVLRRYVAKVRHPRSRKVYLRIETDPGEQAQVDWGHFGHMRVGGAQRPVSAFSMVLSWSRAIYVDFCFDQQMETFCRMHRRALEFFGGIPRRIVYDNLKSVVLSHVGAVVQFNPRFLAFAGHYIFEPVAAPVRYPEYKGRVEASIKYIRHSFFYGRSFASLEDLRAQVGRWRDDLANQRLHGTTRERPADRLLVERPRLRALPPHPFDTDLVIPVIVSKEARVRLDSNSYSVPHTLVGKSVHIRADDHKVRIIHDGVEVAAHPRCWDRRRHIQDPAHTEDLLARRKAARPASRRAMLAEICPESHVYFQEISRRRIRLDSEMSRIFRLIDQYGQTEVAGAIAKAVGQRNFAAKYVRALCDQARFARGLGEPPEPVVTGNREADSLEDIQPHDMETYDDLF
jgi:transposase